MKTHSLPLCLLLLLIAATTATAAKPEVDDETTRGEHKRYFENLPGRAILLYPFNITADLLDCVHASGGIGLGLGANVRATKALQAGVMAYDSVRAGLHGRQLPIWHENSIEGGVSLLYLNTGDTEREPTEVGATVHLALIGADASINLEELLDFVGGLIFIDPLEDNL